MNEKRKILTVALIAVVLMGGCVTVEEPETSSTSTLVVDKTTTTQTKTTSTVTTGSITSTSTLMTITTSTTKTSVELDVSIESDRELYHSNELINITVTVISEKEIGGAALRVYGLKKSSYYYLDKKENIDIKAGVNVYRYEMKTPRCNVCSGIKAGTYNINAEITYLGGVVGAGIKEVEIRQ